MRNSTFGGGDTQKINPDDGSGGDSWNIGFLTQHWHSWSPEKVLAHFFAVKPSNIIENFCFESSQAVLVSTCGRDTFESTEVNLNHIKKNSVLNSEKWDCLHYKEQISAVQEKKKHSVDSENFVKS